MIHPTARFAVTLATTALTIYYAGPEPYAAVLILVGAPMLVVILHALRSGSVPALVVGGLFLGVSATFYTLFTGLFFPDSRSHGGMALVFDALRAASNTAVAPGEVRRERVRATRAVVVRLIGMGVLSGVVALLVWAPYQHVCDRSPLAAAPPSTTCRATVRRCRSRCCSST